MNVTRTGERKMINLLERLVSESEVGLGLYGKLIYTKREKEIEGVNIRKYLASRPGEQEFSQRYSLL
jgi:hypothetical protein